MGADPVQVARAFGAAAECYEQAAQIQAQAAQALLMHIPRTLRRVLDAGCGTGLLTHALAGRGSCVTGLDLSAGMLQQARMKSTTYGPSPFWVQGDMTKLPCPDRSFDGVVSNFALQWLADPGLFFKEAARILRPGGGLWCTTLLPGTLAEIEQAWRFADPDGVHVNRFVPEDVIRQRLAESGWKKAVFWRMTHTAWFDSPLSAVRSIKAVGAHNINTGRPAGLTGKRRWQRFCQAYACQRSPNGIPLTYQILFIKARLS